MFEAHIDAFTRDGYIEGWARFSDRQAFCIVRISLGDTIIARGVADKFRHDLLVARIGHGHYAYRVKTFFIPKSGDHIFTLSEEITGLRPTNNLQFKVTVPRIEPYVLQPLTAEVLLRSGTEWTDSEIYEHADAFDLEKVCKNMGIDRFVDVAHIYVLNRRANPEELSELVESYLSGRFNCCDIFRLLLTSEERRKIKIPLPSPFSSKFPF